ncbi:hypothetical protein ONZ45_g4528 [Pleurotus djamor]|nr:hypothetical protein ONZ45_g4528 [Pleurotus djamor]
MLVPWSSEEDLIVPFVFEDAKWKPKPRVPYPSLATLLNEINPLALHSLTAVILRNLIWTTIHPDLRRALISLLYKTSINAKRLLKLDELKLFGGFDAELEAPIQDLSISSAPNLINLDIGKVYSEQVTQ